MPDLLIKGGLVVDPANGIEGRVTDLWVDAGKFIHAPTNRDTRAARTIDAAGFVVMPAGVDVHCHIAGSKVNGARAMQPENARGRGLAAPLGLRSGTLAINPTTFSTGYLYAGLGYGTPLDASIPPLAARHAHQELDDTPLIDKAFLVLMGNNHLLMDEIARGSEAGVRDRVAWLLGATRGFGVKAVNPGGVERWKQGKGNVATLDDAVDGFGVTPRSILVGLARAIDELRLPHPLHVHGLNLGIPGNWRTTLETLRALDGHRVHLAHVQFHSYGDAEEKSHAFGSGVAELAEYVNTHDHATVDVGQVMFGEATAMTADSAVGQFLARVTGRKWFNLDVEAETGCGVVPITYSETNVVHALQWAIGLEWFLRVDDPWKLALSTDHPNGGSFLSYPRLIALLMDRGLRADVWKRVPESVKARVGLPDLTREYSLADVAIVTRAGPARMLGLPNKGHLGPGGDANVTVYAPCDDKERMFTFPRWVIKAGEVVVEDGEVKSPGFGRTLHVEPGFDEGVIPRIAGEFEQVSSISFANFGVGADEVGNLMSCELGIEPGRRGGRLDG